MGYKIYSLVVAFALFGSIASGNKRDKRGGITVVSGVDESGKEYGGIYRFSDDGPGLFNRFGDDEPVVFDNPFRPTNNFDYNTFLNNYINIFSNMVRVPPTYGGSSSHASAGFGFPNAFDEDFHRQFDIQFNNNNFPWNLQNNMEILQKVNEAAVNAANNVAATNGFEFNYKPGPEPDFAFATGSLDPRETYVKTEINKPNQRYPNLNNRFQNPESDPSKPHFQSIQAFASTSSLNDNGKKSSARRAEVITNVDGHVQRYLTKDP